MLRWPDYFVDPPSDTTSGDVNFVIISGYNAAITICSIFDCTYVHRQS